MNNTEEINTETIILTDDILLKNALAGWLELEGQFGTPITICDENHIGETTGALIVLYDNPEYEKSPLHRSLLTKKRKYRHLPLPLNLSLLTETIKDIKDETADDSAREKFSKPVLFISKETRVVDCGNDSVRLSKREFALLEYFEENPDRLISREELRDKVWGGTLSSEANGIDVYVSYLRKKLEPLIGSGVITSLRGKGYIYHK